MAYDTQELYDKAEAAIKEHGLFFIEDIVAYLPCDKTTFYAHFPKNSNELNALKQMLEVNRVHKKVALRKNWSAEDAPAGLQMGLMKLICNDDERERLSMNYNRISMDENPLMEMTEEELEEELENILNKFKKDHKG